MKTARASSLVLCAALLGVTPAAIAQTNPTADQIVQQMLEHDAFGWEGAEAHLHMTMRSSAGETRDRSFSSASRRDSAGLVRSVVRFENPPDVAGTAFL